MRDARCFGNQELFMVVFVVLQLLILFTMLGADAIAWSCPGSRVPWTPLLSSPFYGWTLLQKSGQI